MDLGTFKSGVAGCALLVFVGSFLFSSWDIARQGIAATYTDPIGQIRAQDEAQYVSSAIGITRDGDWLTPKLMGRPFFLKPPLLVWLAAISIRCLGLSLLAVRLPSLIFGAAGATAVFVWIARYRSNAAGLFGSAMLVMSPFWQTLSRLCYTDMLVGVCSALALTAIALDPAIGKRATAVWFGVFAGAAVLSKSLAGVLPVIALVVFLAVTRRRPKAVRILEMGLAAVAIAAPWPIYQALVHPQWFWAEAIQYQLLGAGIQGMATGEFQHSSFFYVDRLLRMDPAIAVLGVAGVVGFFVVKKNVEREGPTLAVCWVAVTVAALVAFQTKNLPYIVLVLPGLVILGAICGPRMAPGVLASLVVGVFTVKALGAGQPWSLRPGAPAVEGAGAMRAYYDLHRDAELIAGQSDDEFYSATIPLKHVRYAVVDPARISARVVPFYAPLGIVLTTQQFCMLPDLLPGYQEMLQEWGVHSAEAVGSTIMMKTPAELADLLRCSPESDFYVPADWTAGVDVESTHWRMPFSPTRVFLLSRSAKARNQAPPLPARW